MDLRTLIVQSGFRQGWIAVQLGMKPTHFNNMVLGRNRMPLPLIERLAKILHLPVEQVLSAAVETQEQKNGSRKIHAEPNGPQAETEGQATGGAEG